MGSSISFYCGPDDNLDLVNFIKSLDLSLVGMSLNSIDVPYNPSDGPFCFLSFLKVDELHPYGEPPVDISDVTDPLIEFLRSYYEPPYLVSGRIYWSNDVRELAKLTKPYYKKLSDWIKKNWIKREDSSFYFGPEANRLVEEESAKPVTFHPDKTKGEVIVINN